MKKILIGLGALIFLVIVVLGVTVITIKPDSYRGELIDILSKKTGRAVKLDGSIHFGVSMDGVKISIKNAALGNPAWASRENMAAIGKFEIGLELLPLLQQKLVVSKLTIAHADIQLETAPDGANNWDLVVTPEPDVSQSHPSGSDDTLIASPAVTMSGDHLTITDSQLVIRTYDGKSAVFNVNNLVLTKHGEGLDIDFRGMFNTAPLAFKAETGTTDFMSDHVWPITLDLVYAFYRVQTKGNINLAAKTIDVPSFLITAGASGLEGKMSADWSGSRPVIQGNITSTHFALIDFMPLETVAEPEATDTKTTEASIPSPYIFSDKSLGLEGLNSIDASIDVALKDVVLHTASLQKLNGRITAQAGSLDMPLKVSLGQSTLAGTVKINAATSPAQLVIMAGSSNMDLADLLALAGAPAVLTGKANANAAISASGDSLHALASSMSGTIDVVAARGEVSSGAAKDISSSLMDFITPDGSSALNCLAARFIATNGVVHDNGILVDTAVTTIAGKGGVNMASETMDIMLRAHTKLAGLSGLLPPLYVGGTFMKPSFSVDPKVVIQNVVGVLSGGALDSGVPDIISQSGQNACLYTLTHPAVEQESSVLLPGFAGQAQKLKDIGQKILKGFFGQ